MNCSKTFSSMISVLRSVFRSFRWRDDWQSIELELNDEQQTMPID